jgi:hypothetical protein
MTESQMKASNSRLLYRCAGPNCGALKGLDDHWWLMWTSYADWGKPVLMLCVWDEDIATREAALHVCGEACAQKLQSQFMHHVRENQEKRQAAGS